MNGLRLTTVVFLIATIILSLNSVVSRIVGPVLCKDIPDNIEKIEVFQLKVNGTLFEFCSLAKDELENTFTTTPMDLSTDPDDRVITPTLSTTTTEDPDTPRNCTCTGLLCKFDNVLGTGLFKCNIAQNGVIQKLQQWEISATKAAEDAAKKMTDAIANTDTAISDVAEKMGDAVAEAGTAVKGVIVNASKAIKGTIKDAGQTMTDVVIGHKEGTSDLNNAVNVVGKEVPVK